MKFKSAQEGRQRIIIRVEEDIYRMLSRQRGPGQSFNDVLRRRLGFPKKVKWIRKGGR